MTPKEEPKLTKVIIKVDKQYGVHLNTRINVLTSKEELSIDYTRYLKALLKHRKKMYCPFIVDGIPIYDWIDNE